MGLAQMEQLPGFLQRKKEITAQYNNLFKNIEGAAPQKITDQVSPNNWLYTIRLPQQQSLRKHLIEHKIEVRPFWVPMNQLPAFKNSIYIQEQDRSDLVYRNCLSLPCSSGITDQELEEVINLVKGFYHV
jgi:perosamine synthetase